MREFEAGQEEGSKDRHIYSIVLSEWPDVKRHLEWRLKRHSISA